jgi:hypothetical protein
MLYGDPRNVPEGVDIGLCDEDARASLDAIVKAKLAAPDPTGTPGGEDDG